MSEQAKSQSKAWRDAIAACIHEYDTNERLREVLERTDADYLPKHALMDSSGGIWMPNQPDGFTDPVKGIHPPKKILDSIRDALNKFAAANADANERDMAARAAADNADSPYERQQALEALKFDTPELKAAVHEVESAYSKAGVYALSLRSPFFVKEDKNRKSRNTDETENKLFNDAWNMIHRYPSHTRRLLHDAQTKEEREQIIIQSRLECREKLLRITEAARKVKEEREKKRLASIAQRESTIKQEEGIEKDQDAMVTIQEASKYANVTAKTIRNWLDTKDGDRPMLKGVTGKGRLTRIPKASLKPYRKKVVNPK